MSVEFMLVSFPEDRDVFADGDRVGVTNHTLLLPRGEYDVSLSGVGYAPTTQEAMLAGTSIMRPRVVAFASAPAGNGVVAGGVVLVDSGADGGTVAGGGLGAGGLPDGAGLPEPAARAGRGKRPAV